MIEKQPSCDDPVQVGLIPVDEARSAMKQRLEPQTQIESTSCRDSIGRVLAAPIISPINVPAETNSAMDGYAIHQDSIPKTKRATLAVVGTAWAGQPYGDSVSPGEAVRIFTGAILPAGTDTVVIQEHVRETGDGVDIDSEVVPKKNVRHAGEDIVEGDVALPAGVRVGAAEAGLIASLGVNNVSVYKRLKVAFFTTGDELRTLDEFAGKALAPGHLFDSNRYTLLGLLQRLDVDILDLGVVPDTAEATRDVLESAASQCDVVVSTGGVSAGDADFVTKVFRQIGDVVFWKIAMRPGRPLAVGQIGDAMFFGLPGNPVAVMVTFLEFVSPAIKTLMGITDVNPAQYPATCMSPLRKSPGRVEYQRGVLYRNEQGTLCVETTGKQGAGRLSSMCQANCLIVLNPSVDQVKPGDVVDVQPFYGLL